MCNISENSLFNGTSLDSVARQMPKSIKKQTDGHGSFNLYLGNSKNLNPNLIRSQNDSGFNPDISRYKRCEWINIKISSKSFLLNFIKHNFSCICTFETR